MNNIVIKGRLCHSPELKTVTVKGENKAVCNIDVAVNRRFGEETDFFQCQAWGKTAEFINKFFNKGQEILIGGSMQCRKWQDKDGGNRYSWELAIEQVEFCGSKKDNAGSSSAPGVPDGFEEMTEDDVPF